MSSNWYRTLLFKLTGAEFHEAVFQFVPADETGAKALRNSVLEKAFGYGLAAGAALGRDFEGPRKYKDCTCQHHPLPSAIHSAASRDRLGPGGQRWSSSDDIKMG